MSATDHSWHQRIRQILALLCCALVVVVPPLPALASAIAPVAAVNLDESESEEHVPVQDEDHPSESADFCHPSPAKSQRRDRHSCAAVSTVNWLAHLPHHHESHPGYSLPARTPFSQGVNLPLRC